MPIDGEMLAQVLAQVRNDVIDGFDEILTPDGEEPFTIELKGSGLDTADVVSSSDTVVTVPWRFKCVHTGPFLGVPPTYVHFELEGATFVHLAGNTPESWMFHRFIDFLCALYHLGISTSVRPALTVAEYLDWDAERRAITP